jgi:hypothetical protein
MEQKEGSLSQRFGSYTSSSVVFPVGGGWWGGGGGGADGVGGIMGGCAGHLLCHLQMCRRRYRGDRWSVGVLQQGDVLAKMEGGPSRQGDLEAAWRVEGGARPIGTNISRSKLRESRFAWSHICQSGLWVCPGKGGGGSQP